MTNNEFGLKHLLGEMTKTKLKKCLKMADDEIRAWEDFKIKAKEQYGGEPFKLKE